MPSAFSEAVDKGAPDLTSWIVLRTRLVELVSEPMLEDGEDVCEAINKVALYAKSEASTWIDYFDRFASLGNTTDLIVTAYLVLHPLICCNLSDSIREFARRISGQVFSDGSWDHVPNRSTRGILDKLREATVYSVIGTPQRDMPQVISSILDVGIEMHRESMTMSVYNDSQFRQVMGDLVYVLLLTGKPEEAQNVAYILKQMAKTLPDIGLAIAAGHSLNVARCFTEAEDVLNFAVGYLSAQSRHVVALAYNDLTVTYEHFGRLMESKYMLDQVFHYSVNMLPIWEARQCCLSAMRCYSRLGIVDAIPIILQQLNRILPADYQVNLTVSPPSKEA
jgi:hypothetical protein